MKNTGRVVKRVDKYHVVKIKVVENSYQDFNTINPADIGLVSVINDMLKTAFCRENKDLGFTRYELGLLLVLYSFNGKRVLTGSKRVEPVDRLLCKNDIYYLMPFADNMRVMKTLDLLLTKRFVSVVEQTGGRGRKRNGFALNRSGIAICEQYNEYFNKYVNECFM